MVPEQSQDEAAGLPQHLTALQRANRIRLARAALKRDVGAGRRSVAEVLASVPEEAEGMTVFDLILAQHRWGRQRAVKVLSSVQLREGKQLGALTARQREALARALARPSRAERVAA